ncbi:MAG: hypothetical protein NTY24_10140, partial [Mycobacterium sp.]|nr:hypothetical protein [Mycobacterium sp.]
MTAVLTPLPAATGDGIGDGSASIAPLAEIVTPAQEPVAVAASAATSTADVNGVGAGLLSWLGSGDGGFPAATPLMWAVAAATRRDSETATANAVGATTAPANAVGAATAPDLLRFLIGDGTADNPNAGILFGNGYSWTAQTCNDPAGCDGG